LTAEQAPLEIGVRTSWDFSWLLSSGFWIYVDLVLIFAPDAYLIFKLAFLAADFAALEFRALRLKRARLAGIW
jgi:hypothetical protein